MSVDGMTRTAMRGRGREDRVVEPLALDRVDLLRVVEARQRPDAVTAKGVVVEQDARDDERPRERPATRLVGAGDVPRSEPPIVAKQSLSGRERHVARIALLVGRDRADFASTPWRRYAGSTQPAFSTRVGSGARTDRRRRQLDAVPVAAALDASRSADDDARLPLDEPRARVPRAVDLVRVVRRVERQAGLGRLACEVLRVVLRPAAPDENRQDDSDAQRDQPAHE